MMDWISEYAGIIGLLFFVTFFTLVTLWVYRPGAKKSYQDRANIPLEESNDE